jgi:hypothetical protein
MHWMGCINRSLTGGRVWPGASKAAWIVGAARLLGSGHHGAMGFAKARLLRCSPELFAVGVQGQLPGLGSRGAATVLRVGGRAPALRSRVLNRCRWAFRFR